MSDCLSGHPPKVCNSEISPEENVTVDNWSELHAKLKALMQNKKALSNNTSYVQSMRWNKKWRVYVPGKVDVCVHIFADTVDCGFVWMKGNTFMVFEEWGPTPATLGSCYPLLCLCSWGDFNEYSCSSPLLAPVRLSTGLCPPPPWLRLPPVYGRAGPSTARRKAKMETAWRLGDRTE